MDNELDLESYYDNEADANRQLCYVNAVAAGLSLVLFILYILDIFSVPRELLPLVCVVFPVVSVVLMLPLFFAKTDKIRDPGFKYFILFTLLAVIILINITVPKHGVLLWPFAILIANHYYNPRIGRTVYIITIFSMLICMYLGMYFGEYDQNLLGGGIVKDGQIVTVDTFKKRRELLHNLLMNGNNRYIKAFIYYYLPRSAIVSLFFMVSNLLNKRTYQLFDEKIRVSNEYHKTKTELDIASKIQLSTLPYRSFTCKEAEILCELTTSEEIGGDLYDYIDIDDKHIAILIGDVSGKGIPAAMFMMKTITSFRDYTTADKMPSQILNEINSSVHIGNESCMFVTCFLAILDKETGRLVYSNAGHTHPVVGHDMNYHYLKCDPGFVLGCFEQTFLTDEELILEPGDTITLYTDGITEARNGNGDFYGEERLLQTFNEKAYADINELHSAIKGSVSCFVEEAPQFDDITFLTLKYNCPE